MAINNIIKTSTPNFFLVHNIKCKIRIMNGSYFLSGPVIVCAAAALECINYLVDFFFFGIPFRLDKHDRHIGLRRCRENDITQSAGVGDVIETAYVLFSR